VGGLSTQVPPFATHACSAVMGAGFGRSMNAALRMAAAMMTAIRTAVICLLLMAACLHGTVHNSPSTTAPHNRRGIVPAVQPTSRTPADPSHLPERSHGRT
jgi:hypothetical protein